MSSYNHFASGAITVLAIAAGGFAYGSGDYDDRADRPAWSERTGAVTAAVDNSRYLELCGSCHFPYQPGLLPALSWERIMSAGQKHFGASVELNSTERSLITNYLLNNAAGRVDDALANRIMVAQRGAVPASITGSRLFLDEHDKIAPAMVKDNPGVRSLSECGACHTGAKAGDFSERQLVIPGYGRREGD
ncbi:MAG: cytochrome C [Gammaproteobacteria bacterium]|nr:cytochrome C [Gammaproteobacteria bacterium]